ncbi:MAG: TetR/AcrR family transcriptional regulator [Acidimicrobiales bacterium]|nr:TetR/AcrR family transcriptional regulator [Acidimicrobiales bacterium]
MTDPLITDGRTARRERNRTAVLDAVLELFGEDQTYPTPDEVATRSGVSLRSVYRYFDDRESLVRSAMEHHYLRIHHLFDLDVGPADPLERRIDGLAAQRLRLFEEAGPVFRAAIAQAENNELIKARVLDRRALLVEQVHSLFEPEFAALGPSGPYVEAAVEVITGFESVDHLRRFRGLSVDETIKVLVEATGALLR